ncbi:MAG TPA: DUF6596 domain-containing protein [Terracidiphilus sp.]|nr:DUF6596 domain-containing protein [Terracidiphilus sp.]
MENQVPDQSTQLAQNAAEAVARRSYGKLVAFLASRTHDVAAAEDALSKAFASALGTWPANGVPTNPEAWLLAVARRKFIDVKRGDRFTESATDELPIMDEIMAAAPENSEIPDERLAMMFACAHPAIDASVRAPLILQVVLGLNANTISAAFLASPAAMAKRLVRAKEKIRETRIPFRVPAREELPSRLETVLDAIYAAFSEGWTDPAGTDAARRDLAEEALYLARLVTELLPDEPEALGLLALLLHAESRRHARRSTAGDFVPLDRQDPSLWNQNMIREAEMMLRRASEFGAIGRYQLEAALQSAHVDRCRTGKPNWEAVVTLYGAHFALTGSPVAALNRSVALAEVEGPEAGLNAMNEIASDPRLAEYQPYWAARAELLARTGARDEAAGAYDLAIALERDPAVRSFLKQRKGRLHSPSHSRE